MSEVEQVEENMEMEVDNLDLEINTIEPEGGVTPKSIEVEKALQVEFDLGTLLVSDPNEIAIRSLKSNPEAYLKSLARDNTQLLINEIWKRPFQRVDDVIITKLPKPTYILPREKPAPKVKPLTKWESYAKEKGITKQKKAKLVWDELVKKWVPRFGYKKAEVENEKDWVLEVPGGADPFEDQFEKKANIKAEKVSKNELQRLRNLAKSKNINVPKTGLTSKDRPSKTELHQAVHVAKKATASLGKFQPKLSKEKPLKGTGKKRKFEPLVIDTQKEKTKNLDVLARIMNKKPKIDMERAVNSHVQDEEPEKPDRKRNGKKVGGRMRGVDGGRRKGPRGDRSGGKGGKFASKPGFGKSSGSSGFGPGAGGGGQKSSFGGKGGKGKGGPQRNKRN